MNFINQLLENLKKEKCITTKVYYSKYNKKIRYLLCAIDLFNKQAFVLPLKDKKGSTNANAFQSILDNLKRKPDKI